MSFNELNSVEHYIVSKLSGAIARRLGALHPLLPGTMRGVRTLGLKKQFPSSRTLGLKKQFPSSKALNESLIRYLALEEKKSA